MAIELDKEIRDTGFVANYWVLTTVIIDPIVEAARGTFTLYKDAASYAAGKRPVSESVDQWASGNLQPTTTWQQIENTLENAVIDIDGALEGGIKV